MARLHPEPAWPSTRPGGRTFATAPTGSQVSLRRCERKPKPGRRPTLRRGRQGSPRARTPCFAEISSVWRAAFAVPEDDGRPTGPVQSGSSTTPYQRDLDRRAKAVLGVHRADEDLTELLPDEVRSDAEFARLSERLGALQAAGIDVGSLVDRAVNVDHPLPDERAADALWWRIVRHLGPAALRASASQSHTLRPAWSTYLRERLGEAVGERVMADAMWPALVAAVHARPAEWTRRAAARSCNVGPRTRRTS